MTSLIGLTIVLGVIPCSLLNFICKLRLLSVASIASRIESVIESAYIITLPFEFLAARPIVWTKGLVERKNPSLSASKIATKDTSGTSIPSRKRLIPIKTSN